MRSPNSPGISAGRPTRLGLAEIRAYQIHLTTTGLSWAGFNVAVCALRFFYGVTLGRTAIVERIPYARKRRQLPVILSAEEVVRFFAAVPSLKHRTALMTAYAAGLRVSEVVRVKLTDIDSSRMLIRVEQGKGGRDRYIMLSSQLLVVLRAYWREARPGRWLFPGQDDSRPLDPSVLQARNCCRCLISMSSSHYRRRPPKSPSTTRQRSTRSCSRRRPRH
jgi:integrase/recombinase XerD